MQPETAAKGHSCFCDLLAATLASDSQVHLHSHSLPCKSSRGVRQCGMWQVCPQSRGSRRSGWRLRRQRRRWWDTGGQGARMGADGGRTSGGGQAGLACRRARSWQASAAAGVAVVGGGGSGGDGGDGRGGNGGGGGRGGGGAAAASGGRGDATAAQSTVGTSSGGGTVPFLWRQHPFSYYMKRSAELGGYSM